ncbi:MAG: CRTAC1 family protein [Bryobacteraceae bacterium]
MKLRAAFLSLMVLCSCKSPRTNVAPFEEISSKSGVDFWQFSGATGEYFLPEIMGSGAALVDYDNDGDLDLYLVQGAPPPQPGAGKPVVPLPAGWKPGNRLFRNNLIPSGKLSFTDVTEEAGVGHSGQGMGVAAGDYDNDGFVDLYVTNYGRNVLYHNNGNGTFTDVTSAAGVESSGWSTSTAFIDYDRDGHLDLVVVHYVEVYPKACAMAAVQKDYCGPQNFEPTVTQLFHNLGNGQFKDVTAAVGLNAKRGPGLGILTGDFNSSGWPSFLVANDGAANHLWLNQPSAQPPKSEGRVFQEAGLAQGLAYASDGRARAGMGIAAGDLYGDGGEALVITNLPNEGFTLFHRPAGGDFVDTTMQTGLFHTSLPFTGFGVGLLDMENRGLQDLFAANGEVKAMATELGEPFPYSQRNLLLRNLGKGKGFEDITASAGPAFQSADVSRAAVFGDVNNDGGIDILVTNNNGPARLLLNTVPDRGHWVQVHLEGVRANRSGYGSVVELFRKDGTSVRRWVRGDGSYLSANDPRVHFGLGRTSDVDRIQVRWLAGACESWSQIAVDRIVNLREGSGQPCPASASPSH